MMSIFTKKNIKTCNSTTKVQNMYKKYSTKRNRQAYKSNARTKKEKYRTNTKVQHAYNKDYHLCNIENMQGKIQSVCIWMSVCM